MDYLFDVYVRESKEWMDSNLDLLLDTYGRLAKLYKILQNGDITSDMSKDIKKTVTRLLVNIAEMVRQYTDRRDDLTNMGVLSNTNEKLLRERIHELEVENERLKRVREEKGIVINSMEEASFKEINLEEVRELNEKVDAVLQLVRDNIKAVSVAAYMKSDQNKQKGKVSGRYINELNTSKLIEDYVRNGNQITKEMFKEYKSKYNITYNGLRARLIKAGVWEGKND